MRARALGLTVAVVAALLLSGLPVMEGQELGNRPPHAVTNPDFAVRDSASPCTGGNNPEVGCTRVEVSLADSWDPDGQEVRFVAPELVSTSPATTACNFIGAFRPDRELDIPGIYFTYAPIISDPRITQCVNTVQVEVRDSPTCNNDSCRDRALIRITVLNDNSPPRFDCPVKGNCDVDALTVTLVRLDGTVDGPDKIAGVNLVTDHGGTLVFQANAMDEDGVAAVQAHLGLIDDNDRVLHGIMVPLQKCQASNQHCSEAGLAPKRINNPLSPTTGTVEYSTWRGFLPVNTRELIVGDFALWAVAFDGQKGNATIPRDGGRFEVQVESEDGTCPVLEEDPPCIRLNRSEEAANVPGLCFAGEADPAMNVAPAPLDRQAFALGKGDSLRPVIEAPFPDEETLEDLEPIVDPNLLLWKVTYQACAEVDVQTGQCPGHALRTRCAIYGKEVALPPDGPFYLSLDTLFKGDQDVAIRVYDRLGRITAVAFHLVTDTASPSFLVDRPEVTYRDILFPFNVLVHDRLPAEVTLHIDRFEAATPLSNRTTMKGDPKSQTGNVTIPNPGVLPGCGLTEARCSVGQLSVLRLPKLTDPVRYDLDGEQDGTSPCHYLIDVDGNGLLDTAFDLRTLSVVGQLLATRSDDGLYNDYVLDRDRDRRVSEGDTRIKGSPGNRPAEEGQCRDTVDKPHVLAFLQAEETQVFSYLLHRHTLGNATFRVTIRDIVLNHEATLSHEFSYPAGCLASACKHFVSNRTGRFVTIEPEVRANVSLALGNEGPLLPGDLVWINATVEQRGMEGQSPEPRPVVVLGIDASSTIASGTCLGTATQADSPLLGIGRKCYTFFPPQVPAGELRETYRFQHVLPPEAPLEGCEQPEDDHLFLACIRRPDPSDNELRVSYGPGRHSISGHVEVMGSTNRDPGNGTSDELRFEVYLGRVVTGTVDSAGRATGSGKEYHIRADCLRNSAGADVCRGTPMLSRGAVLLDSGGNVTESFDLTFKQVPTLRYEFSVDGTDTVLYWDPQERVEVDPEHCGFPADSEVKCMRPVTVMPTAARVQDPDQRSPGAALGATLALLGAAVAIRRKRD